MCGFAGFFSTDICDESVLHLMAATLNHRGPDDQGVWRDTSLGVGMAHARLSILDLSPAGHQPMLSASDRYVISFNGEIYNHPALRAELEKDGLAPNWRGNSDTETILAGFDSWGIEATATKMVGMFAFAVWDKTSREITLLRDRMGEKPLYYGWQGNTFLFASELKALKVHPSFNSEVDRNALATFMRHGYIPAPMSIYKEIHKLPAGSLIKIPLSGRRAINPKAYWRLEGVARKGLQEPFVGSDSDALDGLESKLSESIAIQQLSDVRLGAFLSGGIDSSTIVALMQSQSSRPIHTFTIGFNEQQYNEATHAKAVAQHLGTDHTEYYVSPDEARLVIPKLPTLYDEPFADSSQIPTFLVSQLAKKNVSVALSGDAGDELFGGYNRYNWTRKVLKIPEPMRRLLATGIKSISPSSWDQICAFSDPILPKTLQLSQPGDKAHKLASVLAMKSGGEIYKRLVSSWDNPNELVLGGKEVSSLSSAWDRLDDLDCVEHQMMALDGLTYLPDDILCKVDRAAMGVSLETRVPFLDHRIVEFAWSLPLHMKIRDGQGKWILRQLLYKYVPREMIERPKMGFGVPIDAWLRGPLREWAESLLAENRLKNEGYLNYIPIRKKWDEHLSGRRNWQHQLWNVLMFQAWLEEQN